MRVGVGGRDVALPGSPRSTRYKTGAQGLLSGLVARLAAQLALEAADRCCQGPLHPPRLDVAAFRLASTPVMAPPLRPAHHKEGIRVRFSFHLTQLGQPLLPLLGKGAAVRATGRHCQ